MKRQKSDHRTICWLWWTSVILLLLRVDAEESEQITIPLASTEKTPEKNGPQTPDELGVPVCNSDHDCVSRGKCRKDADGYGRCMCPSSCPQHIPLGCRKGPRRGSKPPCLLMDGPYRQRFSFPDPMCANEMCLCPPMFDEVTTAKNFPIQRLPPRKCDRRELQVVGYIHPSASVYKGNDITMYCCINMDPTNVVDHSGVVFIHNSSVQKDPTSHPFQQSGLEENNRFFLTETPCWKLEISNVQLSDSGTYMCLASYATSSPRLPPVNFTMEFEVKSAPYLRAVVHQPPGGVGQSLARSPHNLFYRPRAKKGDGLLHIPSNSSKHKHRGASKKVKNFAVVSTPTNANVTWETEDDSLRIDLRLTSHAVATTQNWTTNNAKSPVVIEKLLPATAYTLHITVHAGPEQIRMTEHFQTLEKAPSPPGSQDLRLVEDEDGRHYCEVDWRAPEQPNGRITAYYVRMEGKIRDGLSDFRSEVTSDDFPPATDSKCSNFDQSESPEKSVDPSGFPSPTYFVCRFGPLKPNRNYSVTVWAANAAGKSQPLTFAEQCTTKFSSPDRIESPQSLPPQNLTNIQLKYAGTPDQTNGPITCYYVAIVPLLLNASIDKLPPPADISIDNGQNAFKNNMKVVNSEQKSYLAYIAESYDKLLPDTAIMGDGNTSSGVPPCATKYLERHVSEDIALRQGLIYTGFLIARVDNPENQKPEPSTVAPRGRLKGRMMGNQPVISSSTKSTSYAYSSYFKPVALNGLGEDSSSWATLLIVFTVLFIFALVAGGSFFIFTTIRNKKLSGNDHIQLKMSVYGPVKGEDIPGEYRTRHKDSDFLFFEEYSRTPNYQLDTSASQRKENANKNRYNDIRAFDETRVKLKKIDGIEYSDYINANFIKAYDPQKKFIAAQGPLQNTIEDFWRMCWEQNVEMIVMVANLTERHKQQCAKYWPDEDPLHLPRFDIVPCGAAEYYADYAIRSFEIREKLTSGRLSPINIAVNHGRSLADMSTMECNGSEYANLPNGIISNGSTSPIGRKITQYHFTNWNDHKAAESIGLLRFLLLLREKDEFWKTPVVIHCSAGVGRTGTLIAMDAMMDMYEKEDQVDVFKFVSQMRQQRNNMVQNLEQYTSIYKVLAEWHLFGRTDLDVNDFLEHYEKLQNGATPTRNIGTKMEEEFKKLKEELEIRPSTKFADETKNLMKNRQPRAVPFDRNRVCLQPCLGYVDSSYINASSVRGYFYPYILAQDPLCEATAFDVWRMVCEQKVVTIVMLSQEELFEKTEKYWPEKVDSSRVLSRDSHSVTVRLISEEKGSCFITRRMDYVMKNDPSTSRSVVQFCFTDWPVNSPVPHSSETLLALIGRVLERQSHIDQGPIVLMCRNGSAEAAVYCAVSLLMERLKAEQRIDVLQTIRSIQQQRPETFTKMEEYAFCYQAVAEYLAGRHR
ncbi:unnamed protein product, partial [Mesorhabditis belari]|uniref:protein-tyrosine-phosphatase n=1 Tax=Mesorhabditis belari TaxID=2138241 RepID=A0AAF3F4S0_9BILA